MIVFRYLSIFIYEEYYLLSVYEKIRGLCLNDFFLKKGLFLVILKIIDEFYRFNVEGKKIKIECMLCDFVYIKYRYRERKLMLIGISIVFSFLIG